MSTTTTARPTYTRNGVTFFVDGERYFPERSTFTDASGATTDLGHDIEWARKRFGWDNRGGALVVNTVNDALAAGWVVRVTERRRRPDSPVLGGVNVRLSLPEDALAAALEDVADQVAASRRGFARSSFDVGWVLSWRFDGQSLGYERDRAHSLQFTGRAPSEEHHGAIGVVVGQEGLKQADARDAVLTAAPAVLVHQHQERQAAEAEQAQALADYDRAARNDLRAALESLREKAPSFIEDHRRAAGDRFAQGDDRTAQGLRRLVAAWEYVALAATAALDHEGQEWKGSVGTLEGLLAEALTPVRYDASDAGAKAHALDLVAEECRYHGVQVAAAVTVTL